jgi:hypothetical protein
VTSNCLIKNGILVSIYHDKLFLSLNALSLTIEYQETFIQEVISFALS